MTCRVSAIGLAIVVCAATLATARQQSMPSLGDVARQTEAARAMTIKAKKTYTNADLSRDPRGESAPEPVSTVGAAAVAQGEREMTADGGLAVTESEEGWRMRAASFRTQVDQLRARLAELTSAALPESRAARALVEKDIADTRSALDGLRKRWSGLETSVRELKLPMSWLMPLPAFPQ